jgi:chemotaxis protein methyltransferase CheR
MDDRSCVELLRWALPRMGMRWKGFRKVRRQVCRRIRQRMEELDLRDVEAYRTVLRERPEEWDHLASLCRVTISRFLRDRGLWAEMEEVILPELAGGLAPGRPLRAWSAGCASGEEPWTLAIVWHLEVGPRFPHNSLEVVATDVDPVVLARAREGRYGPSSLRELDSRHRQAAFVEEPPPGGAQGESEGAGEGRFRLRDDLRGGVHFLQQDLTREMPAGPFQLILCRAQVPTNPYRPDYTWGDLPDGRNWGATSAMYPAPDGNLWVAERCGQNTCVGSDLDPVLLMDPDGNVLRSFGAGLISWPHGMYVEPNGNVWITDAWVSGRRGAWGWATPS